MSLAPPAKVRKPRETLHAKAKGSPGYRSYLLYDEAYCGDVLGFALDRCRADGGAPGIDGQTFADIEGDGVERWLDERAEDRRSKTYRPQPVRRVCIPKPDGKQRPLRIGAIRDRVAQMATVLVREPIFEVDRGEYPIVRAGSGGPATFLRRVDKVFKAARPDGRGGPSAAPTAAPSCDRVGHG